MTLPEQEPSQADDAARAGWLYYVAGMTQDQIARELGVSRQRAQRLVSRAMADGLVHVRIEHPIAACLELEQALTDRFGLTRARVAPGLGQGADAVRAIAPSAAQELERFLAMPDPLVIALGTGRALRGMVDAMTTLDAPQHRLVSMIGNIAPDGSASFFDVIMRIADKVRAPHYPMPMPVISSTREEFAAFTALGPIRQVRQLAERADVIFVGVGQMGDDAPLLADGFITRAELASLQKRGAVGEVAGWVFDAEGRYLESPEETRLGGVRIDPRLSRPAIGVAAGPSKVPAIHAALKAGILNGVVTDESSARAILARG
ncbi:sugar-binding transcriptional regulator [Rhodobacteraceae bacterium HSP-20]|uniref:Sugar-binding transcriptional regulator n=1 Tax=Paragemmobacter amnigenus TaxID=2852097 RepID=A0ABS6IZ20_9RHOB|nr:sugar-binding transcriptional regulator [Rhodobacter amnigenus]MBU9696565.1 sugar-binding transcriptional regulator [Rhodobacter amnigenus]MBV4387792.1 sugar-binding transcriptional regulator [Rhodobacter amnigenus]